MSAVLKISRALSSTTISSPVMPPWKNAQELSEILLRNCLPNDDSMPWLAFSKPAGLSVWGEGRPPSVGRPEFDSALAVAVLHCLPFLRHSLTLSSDTQLTVVRALQKEFSGLVLLSKNDNFSKLCDHFYGMAERHPLEHKHSLFQKLLVICAGAPQHEETIPALFPLATITIKGFSTNISFRPSATALSLSDQRMCKRRRLIAHRVVDSNHALNCSLVEVRCNHLAYGLVPLYLLHEGCRVLGEHLQASRLIRVGSPLLLPPDKALLDKTILLPSQLRQALSLEEDTEAALPQMIHRSSLLVPQFGAQRRLSWQEVSVDLPNYFKMCLQKLNLRLPT